MGRFGNSLAIWIGIRPADLLLYTFLPPMLLDAAMRIDFFLFQKVCLLGSMRASCWLAYPKGIGLSGQELLTLPGRYHRHTRWQLSTAELRSPRRMVPGLCW